MQSARTKGAEEQSKSCAVPRISGISSWGDLSQDVSVVRTRSFVAVIPARDLLLIGVRGTQFAYDWLINLNAAKAIDANGERFHRGFLPEARELAVKLGDWPK